ncbi:hypothetical protein AWJ20_4912 [Sugiyamaella lignohabitans]|uniref:SDE2-like domain-containing protein n=1 Tax=Sugiyamaella lignohabitans TaxID=796027 RepID=A0A167EE52_9ASCO|nr:uncharacterized protein AWJ20_4912 [Sugiyamaella lignohabitans]ANB13959.1 hypothetical protein AWJ20_4912 [Sugiyamaella lignohabitans]
MTYFFVKAIPGVQDFGVHVASLASLTVADLISQINSRLPPAVAKSTYVSMQNGSIISQNRNQKLSEVFPDDPEYLLLRLNGCLCGGKGGFGSMLRDMGKKKRKKGPRREEEMDSFKTLDGRSMKSIRQAKELLAHLDKLPEMEKQKIEKKRAKLLSIIDSANRATNSASSSKFSDTDYLETCEKLVSDVRQAVMNHSEESLSDSASVSSETSKSSKSSVTDSEISSKSTSLKGKEKTTQKTPNIQITSSEEVVVATSRPKAMNFFEDEDYDEDDDE